MQNIPQSIVFVFITDFYSILHIELTISYINKNAIGAKGCPSDKDWQIRRDLFMKFLLQTIRSVHFLSLKNKKIDQYFENDSDAVEGRILLLA